jgi:hypothetical protein
VLRTAVAVLALAASLAGAVTACGPEPGPPPPGPGFTAAVAGHGLSLTHALTVGPTTSVDVALRIVVPPGQVIRKVVLDFAPANRMPLPITVDTRRLSALGAVVLWVSPRALRHSQTLTLKWRTPHSGSWWIMVEFVLDIPNLQISGEDGLHLIGKLAVGPAAAA